MAYTPPNSNGQTTKANSAPVTLASDQNNALESGGNLASIVTNTGRVPAQGAALTAASTPVNIASDQIVNTRGNFLEVTGLSAAALNADLVPSTDVSAYKYISVQMVASGFSGTLTFQGSNDNTNFISIFMEDVSGGVANNGVSFGGGANRIYGAPVKMRYFRVRATSFVSGSATAVMELSAFAPSPAILPVASSIQNGTWTVQPGNTANTTAWLFTDRGTTSTPTRQATSTTVATLKAANAARKEIIIVNESSGNLYIKYGATATLTDYTYKMTTNSVIQDDKYTGIITGLLDTGTGNAQVSEVA